MFLNPDCKGGKHDACNGDAWDNHQDEPADCGCTCHSHTPPILSMFLSPVRDEAEKDRIRRHVETLAWRTWKRAG